MCSPVARERYVNFVCVDESKRYWNYVDDMISGKPFLQSTRNEFPVYHFFAGVLVASS